MLGGGGGRRPRGVAAAPAGDRARAGGARPGVLHLPRGRSGPGARGERVRAGGHGCDRAGTDRLRGLPAPLGGRDLPVQPRRRGHQRRGPHGAGVRPRAGWPGSSARPCTTPWTSTPRSRTRRCAPRRRSSASGSSPAVPTSTTFRGARRHDRHARPARPGRHPDRRAARPRRRRAAPLRRGPGRPARRRSRRRRQPGDRRGRRHGALRGRRGRRAGGRPGARGVPAWRTVPAPARGAAGQAVRRAADRAPGRAGGPGRRSRSARSSPRPAARSRR